MSAVHMNIYNLTSNLLNQNRDPEILQVRKGGVPQNINTTLTTLDWTITDVINTDYFINNSSSITILQSGTYRVKLICTLEAVNNSANFTCYIYHNSTELPSLGVSGYVKGNSSTPVDYYSANNVYILNLVPSDLISTKCKSVTNINLMPLSTILFIERLGKS